MAVYIVELENPNVTSWPAPIVITGGVADIPASLIYTLEIDDPTADNTPIIQAALALPGYAAVMLPPGTIELNTPIQGVNNRLLMGSGKGQTILKVKPTFTYTGSNNAPIDVIGKTGFSVSDLTIKCEKIGWTLGGGFGTRLCAIRHRDCSDFYVERVDAYDVSGYAFFAQGTGTLAANTTRRATYRSCWAYNAHVDFEQMASTDITLDDCHARLGTGDIPSDAMFHPLLRSKNIHFQNCTGEDNGSGILIVSSTGPMSSITMDSCRIVSNNFYAINITDNSVPANAIAGIKFDNTHFESLNAEGVNFSSGGPGAPMMISNCTFKVSRAVGTVGGFYLVRSENTRFSNCTIESYAGTTGATSSALGSDDAVYFDGALIASGVAGTTLIPVGSATKIHLSQSSTITPSAAQNSAVRVFFQGQTVATTVSAGASSRVDFTLPGPCLNENKVHMTASLRSTPGFTGVPSANLSARYEYATGSQFVTIWMRGDFGGQTLSWQFTEGF